MSCSKNLLSTRSFWLSVVGWLGLKCPVVASGESSGVLLLFENIVMCGVSGSGRNESSDDC